MLARDDDIAALQQATAPVYETLEADPTTKKLIDQITAGDRNCRGTERHEGVSADRLNPQDPQQPPQVSGRFTQIHDGTSVDVPIWRGTGPSCGVIRS